MTLKKRREKKRKNRRERKRERVDLSSSGAELKTVRSFYLSGPVSLLSAPVFQVEAQFDAYVSAGGKNPGEPIFVARQYFKHAVWYL